MKTSRMARMKNGLGLVFLRTRVLDGSDNELNRIKPRQMNANMVCCSFLLSVIVGITAAQGATISGTIRNPEGGGGGTTSGGHFGTDGFGSYIPNPGSTPRVPAPFNTLTNYFAWEAQRIAAAGMTWNRTLSPTDGQFSWDKVESTKGVYDWSQADALVRACQANNIQMLALVQCGTEWDGSLITKSMPPMYLKPNDTNAYKAFLTAMVARYNGDGGTNNMPGLQPGYAVKHWEISNEPEGYFGGSTNAPQQYLDYFAVLKMSCETIKQADPGAVVMNGGAVPIYNPGTPNQETGAMLFWNYVLGTLSGSNYIDVLNIHYSVPDPSLPLTNYLAYWSKFNKPIWVTETGFYSGAFTKNGTSYPNRTGQQQAAAWVQQCCYGLAHNVQKLFWAPFYQDAAGLTPDWFQYVAMVDSNQVNKLIYTAQQILATKVDAYTSLVEVAYSDTAGQYKFVVASNLVEVLWNDSNGVANVSGDFTSGWVRVTDALGNVSTQSAASVALGSTPVFVEATGGGEVIEPMITANGLVEDVYLNSGDTVRIAVQMMNIDPYIGTEVDWWIVALTGSSWYYLNNSFQWTPDDNMLNWHPVHQGGLFNLPAYEVLNISLPRGTYIFYFAVDLPMNGILNMEQIWVDSVTVNVQ